MCSFLTRKVLGSGGNKRDTDKKCPLFLSDLSGSPRAALGSSTTEWRAPTSARGSRRIYKCIPDLNAKLEEWAPFHMLLMLEWLRAFVACDMELPPGDERTEGSYAHRAVALQTPEGKLREWVEAFSAAARLMLEGVLDATALAEAERGLVRRAFQPTRVPLDPVATLR